MNKTTEVFESENSNYSSTSVERALKLAENTLRDIIRVYKFETGTPVTALAAIREALAEPVCEHRIADARNEFVKDGYICIKCGALFRAADHAEPVKQEPVYAFRRRGLDDFCTCTKERYEELVDKPNLFEVTTLYAAPVDAKAIRAEALEQAAKVCEKAMIQMNYSEAPYKQCAAAIRGMK